MCLIFEQIPTHISVGHLDVQKNIEGATAIESPNRWADRTGTSTMRSTFLYSSESHACEGRLALLIVFLWHVSIIQKIYIHQAKPLS